MAKKNTVVKTPVVIVEEQQAPVVEVKVPEPAPVPVLLSSGKWAVGPTTEITCVDCGAPRLIKIQDAFQVTRCTACQKKAQNKKRAQKKAAKGKADRQAKALETAYRLVAEAEAAKKAQAE